LKNKRVYILADKPPSIIFNPEDQLLSISAFNQIRHNASRVLFVQPLIEGSGDVDENLGSGLGIERDV
jgi:hypothetical protein